jgi:hypothetical protein
MTLIQAFAVQLDGHVQAVDAEKGTCTIVRFPVAT